MVTTIQTEQIKPPPFTDFGSVTPKTDISDLDLNWKEQDLPQRIRTKHVHRLHPYLGKFVPQLVEIFLRKYQPRFVVDPFCGSGTTLVEALTLGIDSFGADISEFNRLLTDVKTAEYDLDLLDSEIQDVLSRSVVSVSREDQLRLLESQARYVASTYLNDWFAPQSLQDLLAFRALIPEYTHQDVLKVILSRAARSARMTPHYDLEFPKIPQKEPYYCYKHSRICKPTPTAKQFLVRYSNDTLKRIKEFAGIRTSANSEVVRGDSREIPFPSCDLVITSPPYVGLIDYHEQHRYAYELLGLEENIEEEIGAAALGSSQRAQRAYLDQIADVFANVKRSLTKGGRLVVIVHDRKNLYPDLARHLGFKVEAAIHRHVDRRTGRRANNFFESVFVWKA